MDKIFGLDSPFINFLNKLADLIWLNILTAICCIPIFTIGASMTAMHYVLLKMAKNEEGYITKAFFKSFKQNFRQATAIFLIELVVFAVLAGDIYVFKYSGMEFPKWMEVAVLAVGVFILFATIYVYPLLARYENTVKGVFRNSFLMGVMHLPRAVLMVLCWAFPVLIILFGSAILPVVFLVGITIPGYFNALLYKKSFDLFEEQKGLTEGTQDDGELSEILTDVKLQEETGDGEDTETE